MTYTPVCHKYRNAFSSVQEISQVFTFQFYLHSAGVKWQFSEWCIFVSTGFDSATGVRAGAEPASVQTEPGAPDIARNCDQPAAPTGRAGNGEERDGTIAHSVGEGQECTQENLG